MNIRWSLSILCLAVFGAGCTVGPDYEPLVPSVPQTFTEVGSAEEGKDDRPGAGEALATGDLSEWWRSLGDPQLAELVDAALEANHDLAMAEARVREARALRRASSSRFLPRIDASATAQSFRLSENAPGAASALAQQGLADLTGEFYDAGFDAGWEIDVFGGVRRGVEAADAQVEAVEASRHGVRLTVVSEVVRHYVELRGVQRRLAVAERNLELLEQTHEQVRRKASVGLASDLDASRALAQLDATRAVVPPLRAAVRSAAFRLSVLTGRPPAALLDDLLPVASLPAASVTVPVGLPSDLLRRRPDLIAAERRLHASTAGIGVATADLYPRFLLTGRAGTESGSFSDLFEFTSRATSFGPSVSWSLFQGGRIRARIEAAEARRDVARLQFEQTLLVALEDVERALVGYAETRASRDRLDDAVASASKSVELAQKLYDLGLGEYLDVLDAERTLVELEDGLAVADTEVVLRLVSLYKALGGGWDPAEIRPGPESREVLAESRR